MRLGALLWICLALTACGSRGTPPVHNRSGLATGQDALIDNGVPAISDENGEIARHIDLACGGFVLQGRVHRCDHPRVESLSLSPNRRMLAYIRHLDNAEGLAPWREIGIVNVDGSHQRVVLKAQPSELGGYSTIAWLPDSRHVTFVYDEDLIETVQIDGRGRRVIGHRPTR